MRTIGLILGIAICAPLAQAAHAQTAYQTEYQRAIQGVVANIQSSGAVVASPSQVEPNYYFDWVRDTALTMRAVITLAYDTTSSAAVSAATRADFTARIDRWIDWELNLQTTPKFVDPTTGVNTDLGEPKFYVNGTTDFDPWGRPQNDGPASRAITAALVANQWIDDGRLSDVAAKLYKSELPATTLIKRDLEYVAHHWQDPSVDLWEEEKGMHLYTLVTQKVAMIKGASLANRLGDTAAANYYSTVAGDIDQYLGQFWDASANSYRYALDQGQRLPQKTTNLDLSILLAAIQTYDGQFYLPVDKLTASANAIIAAFTTEFKINQTITHSGNGTLLGVALGRYPGDKYSGFDFSSGNPWFLSTLALGEFYCDVNKTANHAAALAQFDRVHYHMNTNGDLSEQYNKNSGFEQGAHDLTWSYTAYITAYRACF